MSRIHAPVRSSLIRLSRAAENDENIVERQISSELGIFGSLISRNGTVVYERTGGCLLRSKPAANIEGGIASGQGYIDSIYLV
jgi:Na+-transporting NADH:ubiquinone oxidoreductase subunit NqrD